MDGCRCRPGETADAYHRHGSDGPAAPRGVRRPSSHITAIPGEGIVEPHGLAAMAGKTVVRQCTPPRHCRQCR